MFSKSRASDRATDAVSQPSIPPLESPQTPELRSGVVPSMSQQPQKPKPAASILSSDITVTGNVLSSGDIQVEGKVEGDIRAQTLIVGESAVVQGEVLAEEVVVHGRVIGRLRGVRVRLTATARVEGDIVHKTIAIESGAHFEGSVQRQEDPLAQAQHQPARITGPAAKAGAPTTIEVAEAQGR